MTQEQILEILDSYKLRIPPTVFYDLKADIVNYEEQEPTTKNDLGVDCISRAEAIKCLECDFDITGKENMKTVVNYINSAHDKIVNLPRVKQEPRKGHWNIKDKMWWVCSACGCQTRMMKKYNVPNFCPVCGADMKEVEE